MADGGRRAVWAVAGIECVMTIRVLVTGGRDYADRDAVFATLDALHAERGIVALATGGAAGADRLADAWAAAQGIERHRYTPDWQQHGRAAGVIRNSEMLREFAPDLVVAFPGGRGTADMVAKARRAGVDVIEIATHGL